MASAASKPRVVAMIQCTSADLYPSKNPSDYCIAVCKDSSLFDEIVLAVPDTEENNVFNFLAESWQVGLYRGAVFNVADRLFQAARRYSADIVVRMLLRQFYLDVPLVSSMVDLLIRESADYICLPQDFNYAVAADVCTVDALEKAVRLLFGDDVDTASRRFSPWQLMEENLDAFKTRVHKGCDVYPKEKVRAIREKLGTLLQENQVHFGAEFPASAYAFAESFLNADHRILDIACGKGGGSYRLAQTCASVTGVDLDEDYIEQAKAQYGHQDNLTYLFADALSYRSPEAVDVIISMHTLEHLPDEHGFLKRCRENLKPGGLLIIEVPLLATRPLGEPLIPQHFKEYRIDEMDALLSNSGFEIIRRFGKSRHVYTPIHRARQAIQYHCCSRGSPV